MHEPIPKVLCKLHYVQYSVNKLTLWSLFKVQYIRVGLKFMWWNRYLKNVQTTRNDQMWKIWAFYEKWNNLRCHRHTPWVPNKHLDLHSWLWVNTLTRSFSSVLMGNGKTMVFFFIDFNISFLLFQFGWQFLFVCFLKKIENANSEKRILSS